MINSISWKNIWRNKLRSLVIITAIAFGVMAGVFSAAMTNGMFDSRISSAIELESSNIQIHNSKYLENKESYYFIENADSILEVVKQNPNVKSASKRIKITAMANTSASGAGVMLYGIEPDIEKNVTKISEKIADSLGTYFKAKSKNQIVISSKLAEKLKVKLKSKIVLTVQSLDGTMVNSAFKVVGIFKTSNSAFDEMTVFVKYQDIANIINLEPTKAHEIAILLNENQKLDTPISFYAATKKANELYAYAYHHLFGINMTGLRFFTVYGPYGRPDMALFIFTKAISEGKPINLYNNGNMKRDFTYVDDIVSGILTAIDKSYLFEIINLSGGRDVRLMEFVNEIEKNLNKKAIINFMPMQPGDIEESPSNISKAKKLLNYSPKISIEEGIKKFVNWYKEYYKIS